MRLIAGPVMKRMDKIMEGECRQADIILKKLYFVTCLSGKIKRWVCADILIRGYTR
jgi:hypothetical protein